MAKRYKLGRSRRPSSLWALGLISLTLMGCGGAPGTMANQASAPIPAAMAERSSADAAQFTNAGVPSPAQPSAMQPQLIKTVSIRVKVNSVTAAIATAQSIVTQPQGEVLNLNDERTDNNRTATLSFRVPAAQLDRTITAVIELGYLQSHTISAEDVTDQLVDADGFKPAPIRILGRSSRSRVHADLFAVFAATLEGHNAIHQRKQGVIVTTAHIVAGVNLGATLTDQDVAGAHDLAAVALHTQALGIRVATVTSTTSTFLVSHDELPLKSLLNQNDRAGWVAEPGRGVVEWLVKPSQAPA